MGEYFMYFDWEICLLQVVAASTFGVGGLVAFAYKISIYSDEKGWFISLFI